MIARIGLFTGHRAPGFKWYVDSVAGNDANNGRSAGSALATIGAVLSRIAAGDTVGLARGSHWREQFTVPANRIEIAAYGAGNAPVLDCSDPIAGTAWTKTAGATSVYQGSITHDVAVGKTFIGCWENGALLQWQTSVAAVDATPGSYTLSDTSASPASPVTLYVHASDGSNPATNARTYEYSSRNYGLTAAGWTNCTIRGIQTQRNLHNDGSLILGNNSTVVDCTAVDGQYHSVFVAPGCKLYNVTALRAYHPTANIGFVWNPATANNEGLYFSGCKVLYNTYRSGWGQGFGGHGPCTGPLGTVTFENCAVQNCWVGFSGGLGATVVVDNCSTVGPCDFPVNGDVTTTTSLSVTNCTFANVTNRAISSFAPGCSVTVANVTATGSNNATGFFAQGTANLTVSIVNTAWNNFAFPLYFDVCSNLALTVTGNTESGAWASYYLSTIPVSFTADNNNFGSSPAAVNWGGRNYTWQGYRAVSQQDMDSAPLANWYVDSVNGNDANSGTSAAQAVQTLGKLTSLVTSDSQRIALAKGSHWREALNIPHNYLEFTTYGTGAKPLIDASNAVAAASWTHTGGLTSTYQATITHETGSQLFIGCWENGVRLAYQTTTALVDANPGSYTLSDTTSSPVSPCTLYVHASDGSNPATNGKTYEYSARVYGVNAPGLAYAFSELAACRAMNKGGAFINGVTSTAAHCTVSGCNSSSYMCDKGTATVDLAVTDPYHPSVNNYQIGWATSGTANNEGLYFQDCTVTQSNQTNVGSGFHGYCPAGSLGAIAMVNCTATSCNVAFGAAGGTSLTLTNCTQNGTSQHTVDPATAATVTVTGGSFTFTSYGIQANANTSTIAVSGATATGPAGGAFVPLFGLTGITLSITHSTINGVPVAWTNPTPAALASFTFTNNTVTTGGWFLWWIGVPPATFVSDYNTTAGGGVVWNGTSITWAAYKTASGQDSHSTP